jgi:hypothetical protein
VRWDVPNYQGVVRSVFERREPSPTAEWTSEIPDLCLIWGVSTMESMTGTTNSIEFVIGFDGDGRAGSFLSDQIVDVTAGAVCLSPW